MTQIIQAINRYIPSKESIDKYVTTAVKRTVYSLGTNLAAQLVLRSLFDSIKLNQSGLNFIDAFADVAAISFFGPLSYFNILSSSMYKGINGAVLCNLFAVSLIAAIRFATQSSYGFTDMAVLAISTLPSVIPLKSLPFMQKHISRIKKDLEWAKPENVKLLEACNKGEIEKAKEALQEKGTPTLLKAGENPFLNEALKSKNTELILFMLEKTQSHEKFWSTVLEEIENQQACFLNGVGQLFGMYGFLSEMPILINSIFSALFKEDNIELFKELWKYIPLNLKVRKDEILKLALRCGSGVISKFLMKEGATIPELEQIINTYDLNLCNFLSTLILEINGLEGCRQLDEEHGAVKKYFNLNHISSGEDLKNLIGIDPLELRMELGTNKCSVWETAIYLGLKCEKEAFRMEDKCGLRPLDYAILFCRNLGPSFLNFLISFDKSIITLGTHYTSLHLAAISNCSTSLETLLDKLDACFSKSEQNSKQKKKNSFFIENLWKNTAHRQLPWGKIEFVNRVDDAFGLTPLHYLLSQDAFFLQDIDALLKAGAKDISGPFVKSKKSRPRPSFLKEKMSSDEGYKFLQLTASELAEQNKIFCEENNIASNFTDTTLLLKGEKTLAELLGIKF